MSLDFILYILLIMIFWDFSLHILELFKWDRKLINSKSFFSYYYPHFRWRKTPNGAIERQNWQILYQRFWITFWGLAFIFLLIYIMFK